ncbi:MAG: type I restriction enzyme endonuclease domain-containing protein [Ornithinibacter sp.]
METTDMAVVVSQSQNELKMLDDQGLDIRPYRERMNCEDLAEKCKDADDPLRLVFVCAMWMTGFDAASVSTVYLDRPMKNHTLMQTIAWANRVFPDKDNGLIVDYVGVFRNLGKALAIYGAAGTSESPIEIIDALAAELDIAVSGLVSFCSSAGVDLIAMRDAEGYDHVAMRDAAVEALLVDEKTRNDFMGKARQVRKLFKALLPNPKDAAQQRTVAEVRVLAERIAEVTRPPKADFSDVSDAVDALLDRSVGAEEYVIRPAADGTKPDPLIDLSQIDFEGLARKLARRKRAKADRLAQLLRQQAISAALRNHTRYELVERIEQLIADHNDGSANSDEYLRRLIELSKTLTAEEERAVREGMTEEELAVLDLRTQPDPVLTDEEREIVKASPKNLLAHLHEKLVQDWRRKVDVTNDVHAQSPLVGPLCEILTVVTGPVVILADGLARIDGTEAAFLYGSFAARLLGHAGPAPHDIDLMVLGEPDVDAVNEACTRVESAVHRPVNPTILTLEEFAATSGFLDNVRSGSAAAVIGELPWQ